MIELHGYEWRLANGKLEYRTVTPWQFMMDEKAAFALEAYTLLTKPKAKRAKKTDS